MKIKPLHLSDAIDVAGALEWFAGDLQLYRQFLDAYLADLAGTAEQLQAQLLLGAYRDAARSMHTLKGLSVTMGAGALARFAQDAERLLKQGAPAEGAEALVMQTRAVIATTMQELHTVMAKLDAPAGAGPLPAPARTAR